MQKIKLKKWLLLRTSLYVFVSLFRHYFFRCAFLMSGIVFLFMQKKKSDLSRNNLDGNIPEQFWGIKRLNLSDNNFGGSIPWDTIEGGEMEQM